MPRQAEPGEVWLVDLGLAAKLRPCLVLTKTPADDELALQYVVPHTTVIRNDKWEMEAAAPFLKKAGVFHLQQIRPIPLAKLERRLGEISPDKFRSIKSTIIERLNLDQ